MMKMHNTDLSSFSIKNIIFLLAVSLFFSGCFFSPDAKNQKETPQTSVLQISFTDITARSVLPHLELENFVLTGKRGNADSVTLKTAATQEDMITDSITIQTGTWEFTMTADIAEGGSSTATKFKDTIGNVVVESGHTTLTFDLKPYTSSDTPVTKGDLSIDISLSEDSSAEKATVTLFKKGENGLEPFGNPQNYNSAASTSHIVFSRTDLDPETYKVEIRYYSLNEAASPQPIELNYWEAYTRIAEGLESSVTVENFSLNDVYHITYEAYDGQLAEGETAILSYSRHSPEINLAEYEKDNCYFMGWYLEEEPNYSDEPITVLNPAVTAQNMTYHALWATNTIYVKQDGTGKGYYETSPVDSLEKAFVSINKIYPKTSVAKNYTIIVDGQIDGPNSITSQEIPSTKVSSLLIQGKTGSSNGNMVDILNGNATETDKHTAVFIDIESSVPVTFKNLKITGGYGENTQGGGITLENGNLTLEDCTVAGNFVADVSDSQKGHGGGIKFTGDQYQLHIRGVNKITGNKNQSDEPTDLALSSRDVGSSSVITVEDSITGSEIGIDLQFDNTFRPRKDAPVVFTYGYGYGSSSDSSTINTAFPGVIFTPQNEYQIGWYGNEAAFVVSSALSYNASDYHFDIEPLYEVSDSAVPEFEFSQSQTSQTVSYKLNLSRTEKNGNSTALIFKDEDDCLYYYRDNPDTLAVIPNSTTDTAKTVVWSASLKCRGKKTRADSSIIPVFSFVDASGAEEGYEKISFTINDIDSSLKTNVYTITITAKFLNTTYTKEFDVKFVYDEN